MFILISVALNVIFVGFVLGKGSRCHRLWTKQASNMDMVELLDRSSIPEARQAVLKEKLRDVLPNPEKREVKRQLYGKASEILTAEEFDADAYRAQLNKMFAYRGCNREKGVEVIIEIASELNQEERKALEEIFSRARSRRPDDLSPSVRNINPLGPSP